MVQSNHMNMFHKMTVFSFELLFPREKSLILCDFVTPQALGEHAVRVFVQTPFPCIAPLSYKNAVVKNMIYAAKFHSHIHAQKTLGEVVSQYVSEELAERNMFNTFSEPLFTCVPLHSTRYRERGYNQAEKLAESIVQNLGYSRDSLKELLIRKKKTIAQSHTKNKTERLNNVKNAFSIRKDYDVKGKDIILVDDVVTTGATFSSAKKVLLDAGAKEVLCVAAAH